MAFKKGGYNLVKKILSEEANNVNEFYSIIDKNLNIKQEDIDEEIKIFVKENF